MQENAKKKRVKILEKVIITGIADKGKAVGRDAEGMIVFVENFDSFLLRVFLHY